MLRTDSLYSEQSLLQTVVTLLQKEKVLQTGAVYK